MKITVVEYSRTFNLGDYNSEHIMLVAELDPPDKPEEVLQQLRRKVVEMQQDNTWKRVNGT